MINNKKIVAVLPAYNAAKTLAKTVNEIDRSIVDLVLLVDDCSTDQTAELAKELGLEVFVHEKNLGYGGNQKTCYQRALALGADIVVMLHPDYQYTPKLIPAMAWLISSGEYDIVMGSRILGGKALDGGMPRHKYVFNRLLTIVQNFLTGMKLSEYHTGYRAYNRKVLERLPFKLNSDDFIFDNQFLMQSHLAGFQVGEISCPTRYFPEASSINFKRSVIYGIGCLKMAGLYWLAKRRIYAAPNLKSLIAVPE